MVQKKLLEFLKNKNDDLKYYITEREVVRSLKNELEIQITTEQTTKNLLISENNEYDNQIQKIKETRRNIIICTAIFYMFLIIISFIGITNVLTSSFYMILSTIPIITTAYIISIANNVCFLKNNKISFFKKRKKDNNEKIKIIDDQLVILNKELQEIIKRDFECRKLLEKYTLEIESIIKKEEKYINNNEFANKQNILIKKV